MTTTIFLALNAGVSPTPIVLAFALFLSGTANYLLAVSCALAFALADEKVRYTLFTIALAAAVAAIASLLIGHYAYTPRPFVEGIGRTLVVHKDNASFPSNHMMFMSIFATTFTLSKNRKIGLFFVFLALAVGWSRLYLGVHYPLDIAGGALIGVIVPILTWKILQPGKSWLLAFFSRWPCTPLWPGNNR